MFRRLVILACVLGLGGCGGRSSAVIPPASVTAATGTPKSAQVQFTVTVPRPTSGRLRAPRYVSVSTQSASIAVTPAGGTSAIPVVVNCTNVCSGQIAAPIGSNTFTINLFDAPNGGGNVLSTGSLTQTIVIDQANTVNVTFNGVVKSLTVALNPAGVATGTATAVAVAANALDAAGNVIVGPGSYADTNGNPLTITLSDSDTSGVTKLSTTALSAPTTGITLSYNGSTIPNPTVTAAAPGVTSASKTLAIGASGCGAPGNNPDLYLGGNPAPLPGPRIAAYSVAASGNAAPLSSLSLQTYGIAVDAQGTIYAATIDAPSSSFVIEVFCSLANATPQRTIVAPSGAWIIDVAVDSSGRVYASNYFGGIIEYAPGAGAPGGPSTMQAPTPSTRSLFLSQFDFIPQQVGVDSARNLYISNGISVGVYGPSASGSAPAASRTISSLVANLTQPYGVAANAAGDAFVLYGRDYRRCVIASADPASQCTAVAVYTSGSSGPPQHILTFNSHRELGPAYAGLTNVSGSIVAMAADAAGSIYVLTNLTMHNGAIDTPIGTTVAVYPPGSQDGDATP